MLSLNEFKKDDPIRLYSYNPHRHVKIWLSKDRDIFLNLENQLRLIRMRSINQSDEIHLVYDHSLLSDRAFNELNAFCAKYKIIVHDVQKDIIPACRTPEEKALITLYQDEIQHLNEGGNVAVGSDILRWLKPVYTLGTYSDFDVAVDTRGLPDRMEVQKNILSNIGSISEECFSKQYDRVVLINDIIAVVSPETAESTIRQIQTSIYEACCAPSKTLCDDLARLEGRVRSEFGCLPSASDTDPIRHLIRLSEKKTIRESRAEIICKTADNHIFCKWVERTIEDLASQIRGELDQLTGLTEKCPNEIKKDPAISDDNEFIATYREKTRFLLLKDSVIYTTGPIRLILTLFRKGIYRAEEFVRDVIPHALAHYQLDRAFKSGQAFPMHANEASVNEIYDADYGEKSDLSWLSEGRHATRLREVRIKTATRTIQGFFKKQQTKNKKSPSIKPDNQQHRLNTI
ncbi:MAG: hypothetical protein HY939_01350 [Gammaproteobacteria bacterium]|nr:hypothetical protein [Gammaproteobacteria bacterium]